MDYRVERIPGGSTAPKSLREHVMTGRTHIQELIPLYSNHPVAVNGALMATILTEQHGLSPGLIRTNRGVRLGAIHC